MNAEVKQLWLDALRGGKYRQAHEELRDGKNKFCCLGVLCDLHAKATGTEWTFMPRGYDKPEYPEVYLGEGAQLPRAVREWAGVRGRDPKLLCGLTLAEINDGDEYDGAKPAKFAQIADVIEAEL